MISRLLLCALALAVSSARAEDAPQNPLTITQAEKASIVGAGNDFTSDLFRQLRQAKGNLFFAPQSITEALSMTFAGARGQTANEMQSTLHFRMNTDYTHATLAALLKERNARTEKGGYVFRSVNALWVQRDYALDAAYLDFVKTSYGAGAQNVDFKTDPEGAATIINDWVEQQTDRKITQLVSADALGWDARLVLTNAVYFKADWKTPFEKSATVQEDFYQSPSQNAPAWMMYRKCSDCKYADNERYQVVALPYQGNDIELVALLPRDKNGLAALEQEMNPQTLREALDAAVAGEKVDVYLPRFRLESRFSLKEPLMAMGMKKAFDPSEADFSGMTGKRELFIQDVLHKAYVEVDEAGTEAAAATAVIMAPLSMPVQMDKKVFRADHPFLFFLRDAHTGTIYFMGRVENPTP